MITRQNTEKVISALQNLEIIKTSGDIYAVRKAIGYFLRNFNKQVS